ncbi:MAG: hypothetical protein NUV90_00685 [Candidatus Parcubacteria bacterium]|nr:hypothetical protein [Candidatus Parcubacteria bacterium]
MAKGNGERPAKKGTKDPLLEELKVAASKPNPPAEVPPRDTDKEDSGISAESIQSEREEDALIDKNIEARRAAETAEPKVIPPEVEHLSPEEQRTYEKIPAEKRESYLAHVAEVRVDKEKKEKKIKNKKPAKTRAQKPKTQVVEEVEPEADGKPNPEEDEEYPAVWRYNRDRRGNGEAQVEPPLPGLELSSTETWQWPKSERTPAEERGYLRKLIEGAAGKTKEKIEWWKSAEEGLIRRNAELDAQLEKIGGVEKGFRWLGEKYNKLGWKSKLAVGASLGLGAAFTAGVSMPIAFACMSGIAAQRVAGLATMYLKFEKNSHEDKWGKEKAMLKAGVYTVLMGLAIKEAIEYASGTELAHAAQVKIEGWLGAMLGHESTTAATNEGVGAAAPTPEHPAIPVGHQASADVQTAAHPVATGEAPAAEVVAEVAPATPEIASIEAKAGDGYERMLQHLWEQSKGLDPNKFPEGSDIRRLIEANPKSIGAEIHRLATDNEFFKGNGTNVRIDIGDKMTVDAKGNIWLGEDILAPEGAPVTPAFHPEAPVAPVAEPLSSVTPAEAAEGIVIKEIPAAEPFKPAEPFISPTEEASLDVAHAQDIPQQEIDVANAPVHEAPSVQTPAEPVTTSGGIELGPHGYMNSHGTPINPDGAHAYQSPKGVVFFGSDKSLDALAQDFAQEHRVPVSVDKSFSILGMKFTRIVQFMPTESGHPMMVPITDPSVGIDPKTFTKLIK